MMNYLQECVKALKVSPESSEKLAAKLILTEQKYRMSQNKVNISIIKKKSKKRTRVSSDNNSLTWKIY